MKLPTKTLTAFGLAAMTLASVPAYAGSGGIGQSISQNARHLLGGMMDRVSSMRGDARITATMAAAYKQDGIADLAVAGYKQDGGIADPAAKAVAGNAGKIKRLASDVSRSQLSLK